MGANKENIRCFKELGANFIELGGNPGCKHQLQTLLKQQN